MDTRTFGQVEMEVCDASGKCMQLNKSKLAMWLSIRRAAIGNALRLRPHHVSMYLKARKSRSARNEFLASMNGFWPSSISVGINSRRFRIFSDDNSIGTVNEVVLQNQYDVSREKVEGKTIVDCGANVGIFSMLCASLGARRVYAFEPSSSSFDNLVKGIKESGFEGVIIPIKKAVGEKPGKFTLNYDLNTDVAASLHFSYGKHEEVEVVRIDDEIKEKVDMIKMDVEGFEEHALNGAKSTIQAHRPIIVMSAYHLPTDKERLPAALLAICKDYSIIPISYSEADLYCEARK